MSKINVKHQTLYTSKKRYVYEKGGRGCFHGDTIVKTIDGEKKIKDINKGDIVITNESKSEVIDFFKYNISENVYKVNFKNGYSIICTKDHKFLFGGSYLKISDILLYLGMEIWKEIPNYSLYQCSNFGRIKTFNWKNTGQTRIMKPAKDASGYLRTVLINDNGKYDTVKVHRIVASTFLIKKENDTEVNHKNAIKTDNRVDNLEWCTREENRNHSIENNLQYVLKGEEVGNSKLTEKDVLEIRNHYEKNKPRYGRLALSKKYNVTECTIKEVISRRTWKHL